jgi:predicted nucleic acid-binding protein
MLWRTILNRSCGAPYVDAHLLAATRLTPGAAFWTRDRRLLAAVKKLALAAWLLH